jgi:uncharacterized protein
MEKTSSKIARRMIAYSEGNLHDINHFLKVFALARIIGEGENLTERDQLTLEITALVHDIACPLCRKKYGSTMGKYQEAEGMMLADEFLKDEPMPEGMRERIVFLVGHHHTYTLVDGPDYQALLEADYLVNADESRYSQDNLHNAKEKIFKTATGTALLQAMYGC